METTVSFIGLYRGSYRDYRGYSAQAPILNFTFAKAQRPTSLTFSLVWELLKASVKSHEVAFYESNW